MIGRLRPWWTERSPRERVMLLVMVALLALTLGWLLLIRPMGDALADARARHDRAVIASGRAGAQAAVIAALERRGAAAPTLPVASLLERKASEAGFTGARVEAVEADKAKVAIAVVRPQAFFGWVSELERSEGLIVDRLAATTNNDATLAVEATFRGRAR